MDARRGHVAGVKSVTAVEVSHETYVLPVHRVASGRATRVSTKRSSGAALSSRWRAVGGVFHSSSARPHARSPRATRDDETQ
eukprot:1969094-Prymnesium_polylepis.1